MDAQNNEWTATLIRLLTLASRLEDEGHYNVAKLTRAAADAMGRRAAYEAARAAAGQGLVEEIEQVTRALRRLGANGDLLAALQRGAGALAADRIPSIVETPHPYVCRTCGHLVVGPVEEHCPSCGAWPATFQWFAPNYWFEALDPFAAIERLRQTPLEVAAALEALSEQAMDQDPREGNWAIRNVITHLRDAQEVLDYRLDLFAAEEHPVLASKAVWTWATREEERQPATREIFEDYLATRRKILARLEALPLADWWRTGLHEEFGEVSLRQQASYFASHELTHLPQLAALREQLAGAG